MSDKSTIVLGVEGMTCSSCVASVEKSLAQIPGVDASVSLVTKSARVTYPDDVTTDQLVTQVEKIGYHAFVPTSAPVTNSGRGISSSHHQSVAGESNSASTRGRLSLIFRLWCAIFLTVPVVAVSMVPPWQFIGWQWVCLVLVTPVVFFAGWPFHRATFLNLRHGTLTMDTLVTMGTFAAYGWSVYALFFGMAGHLGMHHSFELFAWQSDPTSNIYLEVAAGVTTFLLLGRYLEERSQYSASDALRAMGQLTASEAVLLKGTREITVPAAALEQGDVFVVRPGQKIATDGVVIEGSADVDESSLTGESYAVERSIGSAVTGSTVVLDGRLVIRATAVGQNTRMSQLISLVEEAQLHKSSIQRLADRVSSIFVPIVIAVSVLTFLGWLVSGASVAAGFTAAIAVLVIACPCALGLATPVALLVGTGRAAQLGIIISGPTAIEQSQRVHTVLLDKTGTVTTGVMGVANLHIIAQDKKADVIELVAALESYSEHPIARAIVAMSKKSTPELFTNFRTTAGHGVEATLTRSFAGLAKNTDVFAGNEQWMHENSLAIPAQLDSLLTQAQLSGHSVVLVGWHRNVQALFEIADTIREDSITAINRLKQLGLEPVLLTGDHQQIAQAVAEQVGIDRVIAGATPESKLDLVRQLQNPLASTGRKSQAVAMGRKSQAVAMVGDGVNDAAALAQADLGLAMGGGTDVAMAASDITLIRSNLSAAVDAIDLSRRTLGVIRGNLFWAFIYNVIGIPLAALGFLNPMFAGAAMAFSSVFVVLNSLRLRAFTPS